MKREAITKILDGCIEYLLYVLIFTLAISKASIEILGSIIIFLYFLKKGLAWDFRFLNKPIKIALFLFFLFLALSLLNSGIYLSKSINVLILRWLKNIILFMVVSEFCVVQERCDKAIFAFLSSAGILALDGLFQKFIGFDVFWQRPLVDVGRGLWGITATFQHYNSFGFFLAVAILLSVSLLLKKDLKSHLKRFLFVLILLLCQCFYWTYSRGSWVSLILGMLLMLVISRRFFTVIIFFGILAAGLFFVPGAKDRFLFVFQIGGDQGRYAMWKAAFQMIRENPFLGHGLGTYLKHLPSYAPQLGPMYAHNSYLQLWAEVGIFSLLSFLSFCVVLFFGSIRLFFKRYANACLLGFLCAFFSFLTHAFFDNHLFSLQLSALFWLLAGFLNAQTQLLKLSGKKAF